MRSFLILLLPSSLALSNCTAPAAESPTTAALVATPAHSGESSGTAPGGALGSGFAYRRVQAEDIQSGDTMYGATLPVLNDPDGSVSVQIMVNPQAHTLEKITVFSVPRNSTVTYKQLGEGVGKYEPATGRYYFNTAYQKIKKLATGQTDNGQLQEIGAWVKPGSDTAAVAHRRAI